MINGFLIKKLDMTRKYDQNGEVVPVTRCRADPCFVVNVLSNNDTKVQLAAGRKKRAIKPLRGLMEKAKLDHPPEIIREFKWNDDKKKPKIGQKIKISDVFEPNSKVNLIGVSKGRGFTGVVKRWNFRTQPRTHGQKQRWRAPGAIGAQTPGRVIKGKKMPGHHGNQQVTIKNLTILEIDEKNNQLLIKGGIPGHKNGWLQVINHG
jgi:large subunit ribosomal protein L3